MDPTSQQALARASETVDLGPGTENRQYQHILAVAASQERRLVQHAALRRRPGYDLTDPWLCVGEMDGPSNATSGTTAMQRIQTGMPCQLVGSGQIVGFLGLEGDKKAGLCRVRMPDGKVAVHAGKYLLPMPTRPAHQGDWALVVQLRGEQERLNGRRGLCGLTGILAGTSERRGHWVMFEPADPVAPPETVLIAQTNLVALPGPPPGAARTPWEARHVALGDAQQKPLALADESVQEAQLALCDPPGEESASEAGTVELSGDDGYNEEEDSDFEEGEEEEEDEEEAKGAPRGAFSARVGDLVVITTLTARGAATRHGRVEQLGEEAAVGDGTGATAKVRFLHEGSRAGGTSEFPLVALRPAEEEKLVLAATCDGCGKAEPEKELLMCENFGKKCLSSAHLNCLTPSLKAVPKGAWYCEHCGGPGSVTSRSATSSRKRGRGGAEESAIGVAASGQDKTVAKELESQGEVEASAQQQKKAKGKAKTKAKAKAGGLSNGKAKAKAGSAR